MSNFLHFLKSVEDHNLAEKVGTPHDEARMKYRLGSNTVANATEFERVIGDYYAYHHSACVSYGGQMVKYEAVQEAKKIIDRAYQRKNQTMMNAVSDAKTGHNGAMRQMLDYIADALKNQALDDYIADTIDQHCRMDSWPEKVSLAKEALQALGHILPEEVRNRAPEELAAGYVQFLRGLVEVIRDSAVAFRRI